MRYYFYSRLDDKKEAIGKCIAFSRYQAAVYFSKRKRLDLKLFLMTYGVSR